MNKNIDVMPKLHIKAIVGLGNPGPAYTFTRHNIGFLVVQALAEQYGGHWQTKLNMEICSINIMHQNIFLIKPMTYMNNSGEILGYLKKQGIEQENILVIHDELELPFGVLKFKFDGSAKGHNGLKSIIAHGGSNFLRLRFGIDRPINKHEVPDYVLAKFKESKDLIDENIAQACQLTMNYLIS